MTRLTPADEAALIDIVRDTAAAEIMPRFQRLGAGQVDEKTGPHDLVTEADLAAERVITAAIRARFPDALILGEEAVAADPALHDRIAGAELAFIIDPVDGTWNFAHGLPLFGVILAATSYGAPIFGLLHDPVMDDWITAGEDSPARQVHADGREAEIRVSRGAEAATASGYMHFNLLPPAHQQAMAPLFADVGRIYSMRCSCHEYRVLAKGAADFCLTGTLNPWDHVAGVFITRRAGGIARMLDGREYDANVTEGFLLTACDEPTWQALRATVQARLDEVPEGAA